jgi:hypothetical protein
MAGVQPKGSPTAGVGFSMLRVTVEQVLPDRGIAICREDLTNREVQVNLSPRNSKVNWPRQGEMWLVDRLADGWGFFRIYNVLEPPVVAGSRAAADPVTLSLLAALAKLGIVQDGTTA